MGNNQSRHGGPHNRLSKPKTNTNSVSAPPNIDSPVSVSSRYADLSARDRQMLKTHLTSPIDTEPGSGHDENGEDSLREFASRTQSRLSTMSRSGSVASLHMSRRNSTSKLASLPGSKLSLASDVNLDTTMKNLHQVKKTASPENLNALHQALQSSTSTSSSTPAADLKRRISLINRSSLSLIRRRSLVTTPRLAAQESPTEGTRRWSSWKRPQLEPEEEAKWNRELVGTSPLTRIPALDSFEGRDTQTPRAQTPADMEYSHLGSLKLGSLIVTNGAASPAPSSRITRRNSNSQLSMEEDLFELSEGPSSPVQEKKARKWGHSRSKSGAPPQVTALQRNLSISDEIRRAKTMSRCDSPLKVETQSHNAYNSSDIEHSKLRLRVVNKSVDTLAMYAMAEIPSSSFANYNAPSPETSFDKVQEQRFEASKSHHEDLADSISGEGVSFREQALRILDGTIFNESASILELPSDSASPRQAIVTPPKETRQNHGRPSPSQADSGYSSGGSVRTADRESSRDGTTPRLSEKQAVAGMLHNGDDQVSPCTLDQTMSLFCETALPSPSMESLVEARPVTLQIPERAIHHANISPTIKSPGTPVSVTSMLTIDSQGASIPKRLQRRRPSQPELPIVQSCLPVSDGTIPGIPTNVRAKFVRRLSEQPAMECLTQTYLSKDHIKSSESAIDSPTSFSLNSPISVSLESPTPNSPESRGRHHNRPHTERPSKERHNSLRRSLSLFRMNSSAEMEERDHKRKEENASPGVVDFGTTALMVGGSPYDAAIPTASKPTITRATHPHQLGKRALPRAKSMVHMDSQTASDFARMKSKDLAFGPPGMPQRPKSSHDSHLKTEKVKTYKRSRHTIDPNVPSVPRDSVSSVRDTLSQVEVEESVSAKSRPGLTIRTRSTGRGVVVSQLVDKFDVDGQKISQGGSQSDWDSHARLWRQGRKSIGEGLRQQATEAPTIPSAPLPRASSELPEATMAYDRYSGGLDFGYERGYGNGGSAGTRQLHSYSYAIRKSMYHRSQNGLDLSDVPIFMQRC